MDGLSLVSLGLLVLVLTPIVAIDLKTGRIPDGLILACGVLGLVCALLRTPSWTTALAVVAQAGIVLAVLAACAALMRRFRANWTLGGGDVKLLAAASAWVGVEGALAVLFIAGLLVYAASLLERWWRSGERAPTSPFAPAVATGLLLVAIGLEVWR